ncbi:MAG: radical SAM protein [Bacillota bacterium]
MPGRYAKLKKDWLLRGWTDKPMTVSNWANGDIRQLNNKGFYTAESCDGETDFNSLAFLPDHHALLDVLIKEGIVEECREGDSIEPIQRYRKANNPCLTGIHWCVTGLCNLKCLHCYMESPSGRYGELPFDDLAQLIEQFEQANVLRVSLTGGEPFMRKDILDIITLLARKKIWLGQIYSNGLLITRDHLEGIKRIGFSPSFQISFDGIGAHDHMRGTRGIEPGVIDGILRVLSAGFQVVVATSIDRMNINRLVETYELMKSLGVQAWRIVRPQESGNWAGTATALSLNEEAEGFMPLLDRWLKDGKPLYIQMGGLYRGGQAQKEKMSGLDPRQFQDTFYFTSESYDCGSCREQPNLLPDGTLVPCPGYVDSIIQEQMPNLFREDLSMVWTNSLLREIGDIKKKDLLAKNPECAACELFKKCGCGCRALALRETGNLMAKDPVTCELWKMGYKKRFEDLARISNG